MSCPVLRTLPSRSQSSRLEACATLVAARGDAGRLAALRDILAANLRGTELRRAPGCHQSKVFEQAFAFRNFCFE